MLVEVIVLLLGVNNGYAKNKIFKTQDTRKTFVWRSQKIHKNHRLSILWAQTLQEKGIALRGAFLKALCQQLDIDTLNAILKGIHAQPWAYELIEYFYHGNVSQRDLQLNNMRSFADNATTLERRIKSYVLNNPEALDPAILAGMWLATVEEEAMRMVRSK